MARKLKFDLADLVPSNDPFEYTDTLFPDEQEDTNNPKDKSNDTSDNDIDSGNNKRRISGKQSKKVNKNEALKKTKSDDEEVEDVEDVEDDEDEVGLLQKEKVKSDEDEEEDSSIDDDTSQDTDTDDLDDLDGDQDNEDDEDSEDSEDDEDSEEDEDTDDIDPTKVETIYSVLKEFLPLEGLVDEENLDAQTLESALEQVPEELFLQYVESKPDFIRDLIIFAESANPTSPDDLKMFFESFIEPTSDLQEFDDPDKAREFLMQSEELRKLYKSRDKLEAAIDQLDDDEVLEAANERIREQIEQLEQKKKELIEEQKKQKEEQRKRERQFKRQLQKEFESLEWKDTRKEKVKENLNPQVINNKWATIASNPKHLIQFADILSHYDPQNGFQKLYEELSDKVQGLTNTNRKKVLKSSKLSTVLKKSGRKTRTTKSIADFLE